MHKNNRGEIKLVILYILAVLCILGFIGNLAWTYHDIASYSPSNENLNKVESFCNEYISKIEDNGYLTDISEAELNNKILNYFDKCEIKATKNKANSGDSVYLEVYVFNTGTFGGISYKKDILVKGTAK